MPPSWGFIYLTTGIFNIIAVIIGEILGKPVLLILKYSNLEPSLKIPQKGNDKRTEMQCCATLMLSAFFLLGYTLLAIIKTGTTINGTIQAFLFLFAILLFPYFRIRKISKKINAEDIDKEYFIIKSPLSFVGKIIKQVFGF